MKLKNLSLITLIALFLFGINACNKEGETPIKPIIEEGVLTKYPKDAIPQDGAINLEKVTEIKANVFQGYDNLKSVNAPLLKKIGVSAFQNCNNFTQLTLEVATPPETEASAFEGTPSTKTLSVPKESEANFYDWAKTHGFATINGAATPFVEISTEGVLISYPEVLIQSEELELPETVTAIGDKVFEGNKTLTKVSGENVVTIGARAFADASALSTVDFPKTVTIQDNAFTGTSALSAIVFPLAENIGHFAFTNATALSEARFPMIKKTGNNAFAGCSVLSIVEMGSKEPEMGEENPFKDTPKDKKLIVPENYNPDLLFPWGKKYGFSYINNDEIVDVEAVPEGFVAEGRKITAITDASKAYQWHIVIPEYFNELGDNLFIDSEGQDWGRITALGVEIIGKETFKSCSNLSSVNMPKLRKMGTSAFEDCTWRLEEVEFPFLEAISEQGFAHCRTLWKVIVPNVTKIGKNAFAWCDKKMPSEGILRLGATPPKVEGELGTTIHTLEIPKESRSEYEKWSHINQFSNIVEY